MKIKQILKPSLLNIIVFPVFIILLSFSCICAQQKEHAADIVLPDFENASEKSNLEAEEISFAQTDIFQDTTTPEIEGKETETGSALLETLKKPTTFVREETFAKDKRFSGKTDFFPKEKTENQEADEIEIKEKFHWKPALIQSGVFLGIQHGFRMMQEKTRRELGGPFFRDWGKSVKGLRGWRDSDNLFTNYVAHPMQGGLTGRIFVNNSDRSKNLEFGASKKYWESRLKAMAWSAAWSTQFEFGPISEASLGNVGIREKNGYSTMAWVDLVVTPTVGTGVLIIEDALDKYVLKNWIEKKISSKFVVKMFRVMLTPTTSFANVLRVKRPSWRENRPL